MSFLRQNRVKEIVEEVKNKCWSSLVKARTKDSVIGMKEYLTIKATWALSVETAIEQIILPPLGHDHVYFTGSLS